VPAYSRGHSLLSLFARRGLPLDAAIIIDAPGPEAVAAGAALAEWFEPVFIFDNWPHARGVVPSHLTLAATLYFAPLLVDLKSTRPVPRPPVFILDSNRLAAYIDAQEPSTIATWSNCLTRRRSSGWGFGIFSTSRVERARPSSTI